ncbi:TatD DNase family protein [Halospina denitrificans]|uniref:TatD DNase family protein n=1 Tax=Halospina denitrificans TaxID=332522 RepID=A0A4R7JZG1_9GAMM|nr:TatD family hydrolase [Halospina denitrificans]TDT43932.1 TatD DNase family protein [Halospina denitrificans]
MSKHKRRPVPVFHHPIIETHCHLDYLKGEPLEDVVMAAEKANIERLITITVSPENLDTVHHLACAHPRVYGTQGIHPHEADNWHDGLDTKIRDAMRTSPNRLLAIGEIGLDYHYDFSEPETQKAVFRKQLQMASELDMPVVIHTREADEDTIEILKEFEGTLKQRGVVHSFTSGEKLARYALDQGWYIGFNGICTFKKAENVREIIDLTPADRILLETDSPFLAPVPYRGKENMPYYLPFVGEFIAQHKGLEVEEFLAQAYRNSEALFFRNSG